MTKRELIEALAEYPDDAIIDVEVTDDESGYTYSADIVRIEAMEIRRGPNKGVYVSLVT